MDKSFFELRELNENDFEKWKELWTHYLAFYSSTVDDLVYETTFGRIVSRSNRAQNALVACKNSNMLGLAHFIFHPDNWNIEDDCYLQDLFVIKAARGHGIGRSLIEGVYAEADKRGSANVYWLTEATNSQARVLYDKVARATSFIEYSR